MTAKKRKGALTIEFACLMIIILAVFAIFSSIQLTIENHGLVYSAVDRAAYSLSDDIYLLTKMKEQLISAPVNLGDTEKSGLQELIGAKLIGGSEDLIGQLIVSSIEQDMNRQFGVSKASELAEKFNMSHQITYEIDWGHQVLIVETMTSYRMLDMFGILPALTLHDRHIIPVKNGHEQLLLEDDSRSLTTVYLTSNGRLKSKKYHNKMCWALQRAKTVESFQVKSDLVDVHAPIEISGVKYTLCGFCKKEPQSKEEN
ncbi:MULTISPECIES: hypothetical protein [unclassified Fusibacter]|uniref:hypothetical protein n=1 Tax=unclassified Fusibacter TaxID=2624464 RepID=UPI001012D700|nr:MULTISPECIES: hypothetical protein [unclassified Fusibacter]MCK8060825.1 hypothetical protein [Fusibacter sp. A2]NPE23121.1 hypothetical protein [Fusibacter sp. A1]RXV59793.1 hypothetical protein DWB64_14915 [Fusibacter sp. A1]